MPELTSSQKEAIYYRGGDVAVSASAGSGKTFVMIERILALIEERRAEVPDILAITFTRAAAEEMREKLRKALGKRLARGGEDAAYFARQLKLLPLATVCTVDAFCKGLLQSYFYAADVDPAFTVLSESETAQLKAEAMDEVFTDAYEREDAAFLALVSRFSVSRKDDALRELLQKLIVFREAERDGEAFFRMAEEAFSPEGEQKTERELLARLRETLLSVSAGYRKAHETAKARGYSEKATEALKIWADETLQMAEIPDLYALSRVLSSYEKRGKLVAKRGEAGEEERAFYRSTEVISARLKSAVALACAVPEKEEEEKRAALALSTLQDLLRFARAYCEAYEKRKKRAGALDFADLERKTLHLLQNETYRKEISEKFAYIFVDEYQDVNGLQEEIVSLLSRNNLFLVGDVKQSIYGFRGCNPDLFLSRIERFDRGEGKHISLKENFRSAEGVLAGANAIFSRTMTKSTSGIDYEKTDRLIFGGTVPDEGGGAWFFPYGGKQEKPAAPFAVYSVKKSAESDDTVQEKEEAAAIADLILSLADREEIFDPETGGMRKIGFGDIAILTRKKAGIAAYALESLKRRGIPVVAENKRPVLSSPEVKLYVAVLSLLKNPKDDAAFAAVLLSAIGKMTEAELMDVRAFAAENGAFSGGKMAVAAGTEKTARAEAETNIGAADSAERSQNAGTATGAKDSQNAGTPAEVQSVINVAATEAAEASKTGAVKTENAVGEAGSSKAGGGFSAQEAAPSLRDCAKAYALREREGLSVFERKTADKLQTVFALLDEWKIKAAFLSARELLTEISDRFGLVASFSGRTQGKTRVMRVRRFLKEASAADGTPLTALEFLQKITESGSEITLSENGAAGSVRMMSMHASKGLEFPVVILAGLKSGFNRLDLRSPVLFDREFGIAPLSFDDENMLKSESLLRLLIKDAYKKRAVKEELCIFYVAATRAKNRTYFMVDESLAEELSDEAVLSASSQQKFLSRGMLPFSAIENREAEDVPAREIAFTENGEVSAVKSEIRRALSFAYPEEAAVRAPVKRSVTEITKEAGLSAVGLGGGNVEFYHKRDIKTDTANAAELKNDIKTDEISWQAFLSASANADENSLSALRSREDILGEMEEESAYEKGEEAAGDEKRKKGIRLHTFLQGCDLSVRDEAGVRAEMERLIEAGILQPGDEDSAPAMAKILDSPLYRSLQNYRIYREKEFIMALPLGGDLASEVKPGEDAFVVQGIVDFLALGENDAVLIDYKYSFRKKEDVKRTYAPQISLYARAIESFYGIKIKTKGIINLTDGTLIEM